MMSDMKVFAHYIKDDTTGNEYRWRTLLQIGNSWNIIGSIVMKNPGSSKPLSKIDDEVSLKPLNEFSDKGDWYSIIRKTKRFIISERSVYFPKTKRSSKRFRSIRKCRMMLEAYYNTIRH